ncbi:MAG: GNAT family N-acetyltransferase [Alphaproteobacteria bacterium]|nr:GNAT family N-acetyltransferase [Alphaproteobacteria bacterium]
MVSSSTDDSLGGKKRIVDSSAGDLSVRLTESAEEVDAALALRYRIFYDEMAAKPTPEMAARRHDFDSYDDVCDHLIVLDRGLGQTPGSVVATYRLIRREAAAQRGRFYSESEFDVSPLLEMKGNILELGRSCVAEDYRNRATMQILWRGLTEYVLHHDIVVMFGCASLPGTDPSVLAVPLSYLHHNHLAPEELRPRALAEHYQNMAVLAAPDVERKQALTALPPLIKGYLRVGGFVGDGAVIDHQFNTTDVCIVVKTDLVTGKYYRHYTRPRSSNGSER